MRDGSVRTHYDCIGIGAGPANLSLASLLHSRPEITNLFLEKKNEFGWHDGQQLPGTTLQVSMLKDLVSLADPTSRFSFLSYLHSCGKIYHFINAQFDAVPRQEFRNYMRWASEQNENVVFGEEVVSVDFDQVFTVRTSKRTLTANNISVGVGTKPWVPAVARIGEQQFHVSDIVELGANLSSKRVCVVGGGQSGAEAFLDLISRPAHDRPRRVSWVTRRRNYFPIDDSPFTNDFFVPSYSDYFFNLDRAKREEFVSQHVLASDGISEATLREIYQRVYVLRFIEGDRDAVALYPNREVFDVGPGSGQDDWAIKVSNTNHPGVVGQVDADVIVWATGFRSAPSDFLDPIAHRFEREGDELRIDKDFIAQWDGPADRNVFLHNAAPTQRGLPDRNLSLIAWRSQRVVDRLRGVRGDEQLPSFIEWSTKLGTEDATEVVFG
ncbi:lysine N6-hydroxylase [Umezawaea tangerina]|uniref:L-lysine N6-monooxygenase MbtG n=2 Tax=Umezawaea tangerina TaxID=84725 RepID=A0A2T0T7I7_9PSEU|nr:SidA/IucD/PvdA family monooxygenase [Umezawaea tangerina]PRY41592.1 lysine N6-hydroxylase [Umezawaea tangerina]